MPKRSHWSRNFLGLGALVDVLSRPFMRVELDLPEPCPDRPVLFAANHRSLADVFVALVALRRLRRPVRMVVGRAFFAKPGMGFILRRIGAIEGGKGSGADVVAIEAIAAGETCGIMPEGKVTAAEPGRMLAPLLPGVAQIWAKAGCPFVVAGIAGAGEVWPHGRNYPPLPKRRPPLVHVRFSAIIPKPIEPWTLDQIAALMEETLQRAVADRAAKLAKPIG